MGKFLEGLFYGSIAIGFVAVLVGSCNDFIKSFYGNKNILNEEDKPKAIPDKDKLPVPKVNQKPTYNNPADTFNIDSLNNTYIRKTSNGLRI